MALDKGFINRAPDMTTPFVFGNLISIAFALYMAIAALILLADGLKAFNKARTAPAAAPGAAGD